MVEEKPKKGRKKPDPSGTQGGEKMDKPAFDLLRSIVFTLALLGILFTINSDVISQHNYSKYWPLYPFAPCLVEDKSIESDVILLNVIKPPGGQNGENCMRRTYIFALDTSSSIRTWQEAKPFWYDDTVEEINKRMTKSENHIKKKQKPTGFDINKVRLSQLLLEMEVGKDASFVVWKFGDKVETLYPVEEGEMRANVSFKNIMSAIKQIHQDSSSEKNTDFIKLFEKILINYPLNVKIYSEYEKPSFVFIIVSDLFHDVENKIREECREKNIGVEGIKKELKEKLRLDKFNLEALIRKLSNSDLIANIIILSEALEAHKSYETDSTEKYRYKAPILEFFEEYFNRKRLEKVSVSENINEFSYDRIKGKNGINFYYTNPNHIEKTIFDIKISKYGTYYIGLTKVDSTDFFYPVNIEYSILNSDNTEKKGGIYKGSLSVGERMEELPPLQKNEKIRLSYTEPLPYGFALPHLKIYLPEKGRKTHLLPIRFFRELSGWSILFFYIAFLSPLIYYFLLKLRNKRRQSG